MLAKIKFILGKKRFLKLIFIMLLMIVGAIIDTCLTYVVLPFASIITDMGDYMNNGYVIFIKKFYEFSSLSEIIGVFSLVIAVAYVLRNLYMLFLTKKRYQFLSESKAYVSSKLFSTIAEKSYSFFTATNTASIQGTCINDISRLFGTIDSILNVVTNFMTLIFIVGVLFMSDVILTMLAFILLSLMTALINRPISRKVSYLSKIYTLHYTSMLKWTQQFVGSLKTVLTEGKQKYFINKFAYHSKEFTENEGRFSFFSNVSGYVTNAASMGLVFGYIAFLAFREENLYSKIPTLALFAIGAMKLMPCVSNFAVHLNNIKYNEQGLFSIHEQMSKLELYEQDMKDETEEILLFKEQGILEKGIDIEHISFRFEDAEEQLFEDISLTIPANKSVAFIGSTGSGKTTLADIILGLYRPNSGSITVDGHDIFAERDWWASRIGYIPQTIYLCEDTIQANVAFGIPEKEIDKERVLECIREAQIIDFIEELPEKEFTITGENGIKLSGGQRQRIGIARALYHNPPFLVFDEATSALDVDTETAIMKTVNKLAENKTILIIAHRLSTIERCDIVYQIEHGKVERVR